MQQHLKLKKHINIYRPKKNIYIINAFPLLQDAWRLLLKEHDQSYTEEPKFFTGKKKKKIPPFSIFPKKKLPRWQSVWYPSQPMKTLLFARTLPPLPSILTPNPLQYVHNSLFQNLQIDTYYPANLTKRKKKSPILKFSKP